MTTANGKRLTTTAAGYEPPPYNGIRQTTYGTAAGYEPPPYNGIRQTTYGTAAGYKPPPYNGIRQTTYGTAAGYEPPPYNGIRQTTYGTAAGYQPPPYNDIPRSLDDGRHARQVAGRTRALRPRISSRPGPRRDHGNAPMPENVLYYGDNLDILRRYIADESVDLIYLDPPFNSNQAYNVIFAEENGSGSGAQIQAFDDTWHWTRETAELFHETVETGGIRVAETLRAFRNMLGETDMMAYLANMAPRLVELRRVLKPTGSIYLHCDPTASHYLKVLMDAVFGIEQFRNELLWSYGGRGAKAIARQFPRNHDVILFYSNGDGDRTFNRQYLKRVLTVDEARKRGYRQDNEGRWFKTAPRGDYTDESVRRLEAEGRIHRTRSGKVRVKYFLEEVNGAVVEDVLVGDTWSDIPDAMHIGNERLGYPTQKPEALLERIISASSNEGDVVLDPFCGCGTTVVVAQRLRRRWIGIDITHLAVNLMRHRLLDTFGAEVAEQFEVIGEPTDLAGAAELARQDRYQFELWALGLVGARHAGTGKGADRGIDGVLYFHEPAGGAPTQTIVLSVKSGHVGAAYVRDLRGAVEREGAAIGVLITLEPPTREMKREAVAAGFWSPQHNPNERFPRIQILTIEELLAGKQIDCRYLRHGSATFRRAPRDRGPEAETGKLIDEQ